MDPFSEGNAKVRYARNELPQGLRTSAYNLSLERWACNLMRLGGGPQSYFVRNWLPANMRKNPHFLSLARSWRHLYSLVEDANDPRYRDLKEMLIITERIARLNKHSVPAGRLLRAHYAIDDD